MNVFHLSLLIWYNINIERTQYNSLNAKFSIMKTLYAKIKSATKSESEVTLQLSSNMIGNSNDGANFPPKFLLQDS